MAQSAEDAARSRRRRTARLIATVAVFAAWHLFALGPGRPAGIPTPWQTVVTTIEAARTGMYWMSILNTLVTALIGLALAALIGVPLGFLIGASRRVNLSSRLLVDFGRTIPPVALLPLILLLWGATRSMALMLVVLAAVWPLLIQATYAVQQVSPNLKQVGTAFQLTRGHRLRYIYAPSALPFLMTGLRVAATMSLLMAISAEFLGGADGLGRRLFQALQLNNAHAIFVYALTTAMLGLLVNYVILAVQSRVLHWHPSVRAARS